MKREAREPPEITRKLARKLAHSIYHSATCPRSMEALRERVDQDTEYVFTNKQIRRLSRWVADVELED